MNRILVIKEDNHTVNPDMGLVIPVAHVNENGNYDKIKTSDFPNGGIFISKGFMNISQQFGNNELFVLTEYYESNDDDWKSNSRHQKHFGLGNKVERLDKSFLIPVIKSELPDIKTGFISHDIDAPSTQFFIEDGGYIYGPFKASKQDNNWQLSPLSTPSPLQLKQDHIAKIESKNIDNDNLSSEWIIKGENKKYINNLKDLSTLPFEQLDYISDTRLVSYFTKNGFGSGFSKNKTPLGKSEAQKLSQGIDEYVKKNKVLENSERLKRIKELLGEFLDSSPFGQEIVQEFLAESRDGRLYLDNYFMKNKELLLKQKSEEIEEVTRAQKEKLDKEISELERLISTKKSELEFETKNVENEKLKAKDEIERIKKQTAEDAHKILLNKQQSLTEENSVLEEKIHEANLKLEEFYATLSRVSDYNSLVEEINYLKRRKEDIEKEKESVEKAVNLKKATLNSPQLLEKAVEIQTLTTLLNGGRTKENTPKIYKTKITPSSIKLNVANRKDYINYLVDSFSNDNGRNFSFDEMANLLICLNQSFMTILAGPPGTGKTSTAIRLAQNMGLTSDTNTFNTSNFLNIPVGRAWVSSRDILGFYNSLKDVYQPARTGLYEFLKSEHNQDYLKLILLDEANLSSVEHYWSDFLSMCDPEGRQRKIDSGIPSEEERHISVANGVRFIATINNDASTERLSPRLIDRVPVIGLNHNSEFKSNVIKTLDFDGAVSNECLEGCFDISLYESSFTTEEQNALEQVIEILKAPINRTTSVRVSQRKYNAIKRYCHIANEIEGLRSQPIDFAINQHILPLIEGYGTGFKERLQNLEQKLVELDLHISKATLKNIINNGDIYSESYSYF
ncbi:MULTISPECIES: AAA family ATPase [Serratia]|uniref:AAA family ATPase n=1 Tax=Serratia TaxID=613 RepID=UPI000534E9EF|nr:AAA family ATPase [Serratia marcescens]MBN5336281.1 AAA family ATPase [Serratia marcescens]MBN5340898.1 AAA family ATPase [Serratia marcescens]MCW7560533.1 AAA family ATPase [Serratia marcescens]MCW7565449.1 AAA family ATPase [Serratia marcescens]MCW7570451.1 AAA family ATPase [Serratia marcescens]